MFKIEVKSEAYRKHFYEIYAVPYKEHEVAYKISYWYDGWWLGDSKALDMNIKKVEEEARAHIDRYCD